MRYKHFLTFIILAVFIIFASSATFFASDIENNNSNESDSDYSFGWDDDPNTRIGVTFDETRETLPSQFDPRSSGYLTDTRNQNKSVLCWMYSSLSLVEQYTSKVHGSKFDFSESYGAVVISELIKDELNVSGKNYYQCQPNAHGNYSHALQYLTNWNTTVVNDNTKSWNSLTLEQDYPLSKVYVDNNNDGFNDISSQTLIGDTDFGDSEPFVNVTDAIYISNDLQTIKKAIYDYGSVGISIWFKPNDSSYFHQINSAYYTGSAFQGANHAVNIVGWDDDFSKDNFCPTNKPVGDGAFLVRNSDYSNSYFWLSYYDGAITNNDSSFVTVTGTKAYNEKNYMLSYDFAPVGYTSSYTNNDVYLCNVYDTSEYADDYNQISNVMMYFRSEKECNYELRIIPLNSNDTLPADISNCTVYAEGSFSGEGYKTINLSTPFSITSNKCAIVLKLLPEYSDSNVYIPFEKTSSNSSRPITVEINQGESFIGNDNNGNVIWNDCSFPNTYDITGNLVIRPVLDNSNYIPNTINVTPDVLCQGNYNVSVSSMDEMFNIHTSDGIVLHEDIDYLKGLNGVTFTSHFINSLNCEITDVILEFRNGISKTITINPKSYITNVEIVGSPIVGHTLSSNVSGNPPQNNYDVNYQWEYSSTGGENTWLPIPGATQSSYIIDTSYYNNFIRVTVTPQSNGNVFIGNTSESTSLKTVILGDCDLDGVVTILDANKIQRYCAGYITFNDRQLLAADFNMDGIVDNLDALAIQQYVVRR